MSLHNKNLFTGGTGSSLSYPFTIRNDVWQHLLNNKKNFITDEELNNKKQFDQVLNSFQKSFQLY
jgi:hypothetical protein